MKLVHIFLIAIIAGSIECVDLNTSIQDIILKRYLLEPETELTLKQGKVIDFQKLPCISANTLVNYKTTFNCNGISFYCFLPTRNYTVLSKHTNRSPPCYCL